MSSNKDLVPYVRGKNVAKGNFRELPEKGIFHDISTINYLQVYKIVSYFWPTYLCVNAFRLHGGGRRLVTAKSNVNIFQLTATTTRHASAFAGVF